MDDITPGMDWNRFLRFKEILDDYGICPLIGVVPDNRDKKLMIDEPRPDFWDYVKQLQQSGWVIAMHGLNHLYTTPKSGMFPIGGKSEFAGLPYVKQEEMIREGKRILTSKGIMTDIFMAPSHSFDRNTIRALKQNGFYIITDGFGRGPFRSADMIFYPISIRRGSSLEDTRDGLVTFVYHTNTMTDKDFEAFEKLMDSGKAVSYREFARQEVRDRNVFGDILQYTTARAKYTAVQLKKLKG
jgi:predicted deacetylase